MIKKLFILVFVFVFLVSFASAFGITPGRNIINYEPGFEKEYSFSIINSDEENINLVFELSGEFSRFIEFDVNEYSMSASEKSKTFNYKIKLPEEDIFYPGIHEGKIIVRESSSGELVNSVGANMGIAIKIDLDISYPDKYLEVYPQIISEYEEGPVVFLIGAKNKGDMDIENVKSEVNILNEKEKVISSFETTESAIASGEVVELTG